MYALVTALLLGGPAIALFAFPLDDDVMASLLCLQFVPIDPRITGVVLGCIALVGTFFLAYWAFGRLGTTLDRIGAKDAGKRRRFGITFSRGSIALVALVLFACWVPVMVLLYPCSTTGYDTINQLYQFFTGAPTYYTATNTVVDANFIDHHPVFDTLLFGGFTALGRMFGNDGAGMFAYSVFQNILIAGSLAVAICYLERLRVPYALRVAALVVCCVFPIITVGASTMQKDSLFVPFFVLFVVGYLEVFRTNGEKLRSVRFVVGMIVLACLCALTKKLGLYICIASALVLLVAFRGTRVRAAAMALVPPLICSLLIPALVFPALDVARGGNQEMLGMFYHQAVAALKAHPDEVSQEDYDIVDAVVDVEQAKKSFDDTKTDGVKRYQRANMTTGDLMTFMGTWARLGMKYPVLYAKAHLRCCVYLVVPSMNYGISTSISKHGVKHFAGLAEEVGQTFTLDAKNPEPLQAVTDALLGFYKNVLCTWPPFSLFFTIGFYGSWVPILAFMLVLYRKKRAVWALTPIILSSLVLLVCPASLARYALPLVFAVVPMLGWVVYQYRSREVR